MRMIRARHAVVAALVLVLAGCKSGGTAGSSWWSANPFKSSPATPANPTNPYPPRPSQLYANSATSSPSSGISATNPASSPSSAGGTGNRSLASSPVGNTRPGSAATGSTSPGAASAGTGLSASTPPLGTGGNNYPATRASYNAPGMGSRSGPLESPGTLGSASGMGSSTATDAITPQRGYYSVSPSTAAAGSGPGTGSGSYTGFGRSQAATSGNTPFGSPSAAGPRFDTPSSRYGNSGVKDPFSAPTDRPGSSPASGTQGFYPITASGPSQAGRGTGSTYGSSSPTHSGPSGTSAWNPPNDTRSQGFQAPSSAGGWDRSSSGPASGMDRGSASPFGPARSDNRLGSATYPGSASEYRPGSTGYQPPASDYRPGQTGYTPPAPGTGYAPAGPSYGPGSPRNAAGPRYPSTSPADGGLVPEDAPYRPGSVTEYPARSPAPATSGSPASVANPWVTPSPYGTGNLGGSYSTGSGATLR